MKKVFSCIVPLCQYYTVELLNHFGLQCDNIMMLWDYIWHKIPPPPLRWNRYGNISVPVTTALCLCLFSPKGKTNSSLSLLRHVLGCKQAIYFSLMEGVNTVEPSIFKARQTRVTVEEGFAHCMFHSTFQATLTCEFPPIFWGEGGGDLVL